MDLSSGNPYKVLGVDEDATFKEIKRAYSRLIRQYRPETHPEEFQLIQEAFEKLKGWVRSEKPVSLRRRVSSPPKRDLPEKPKKVETQKTREIPPAPDKVFKAQIENKNFEINQSQSPRENAHQLFEHYQRSNDPKTLVTLIGVTDIAGFNQEEQFDFILKAITNGNDICSHWIQLLSYDELVYFLKKPEVNWSHLKHQPDVEFSIQILLWKIFVLLSERKNNEAWAELAAIEIDYDIVNTYSTHRYLLKALSMLAFVFPKKSQAFFRDRLQNQFKDLSLEGFEWEEKQFLAHIEVAKTFQLLTKEDTNGLAIFNFVFSLSSYAPIFIQHWHKTVHLESRSKWQKISEILKVLSRKSPSFANFLTCDLNEINFSYDEENDQQDDKDLLDRLDPKDFEHLDSTLKTLDKNLNSSLLNSIYFLAFIVLIFVVVMGISFISGIFGTFWTVTLSIIYFIKVLSVFVWFCGFFVRRVYDKKARIEFVRTIALKDKIFIEHISKWISKYKRFSDEISTFEDQIAQDQALKIFSQLVKGTSPSESN